jgi:carboxymethylenebutenolidase
MSSDSWTISMTRRGFVVTALATGFALAVRPVAAETIATPATGLQAGEIQIPTMDGRIPAYRARPAGGTPVPVILVVQEIFGVHEHIKDICRRLARLGYLAIAPELYARHGDVSRLTDIDAIRAVVAKVPDEEVLADLDAAVAWAKASGEGDATRVGVTGFCWGGRIVWLYAAHSPVIKAGVAWYGRLVGKPTDLQKRHPIDVAASLKAPVLGLYGAQDQGIPVDTVEQMQRALATAGSKSEIVLYPDTPHGFHADYRPSYRKEPAEDGWRRMREWFETHGVTAPAK